MDAKVALITGVTGQDGSYLAELLLSKGYEVHGLKRRGSSFNTSRVDHLVGRPEFSLHYGDMTDGAALAKVLKETRPTEVYNLAAQSHVRVSFDVPEHTCDAAGMGTLRLLEAMRIADVSPRFYQASSSEMFGGVTPRQDESTPFRPRSPYACAKLLAHQLTVNYREAYGMHASCGILFNHESPRRGETFVTRKITMGLARIKCGLQSELSLGNLDASRDWGFAGDYVEAMWRMLQQPSGDDYVVATGEAHSVREFLALASAKAGIDPADLGRFVTFDPRLLRPTEVDTLLGDASKARSKLGWSPSTSFEQLVEMMVESDMELARREVRARG